MNAEPIESQPVIRSWWRAWRNWLKLLYALITGLLCCLIAAFAPSEGPPLRGLIPANAALVFHIRDGKALVNVLASTPAFQELAQDPDVSVLLGLKPREPHDSSKPLPPVEIFRQTIESIPGEKASAWKRALVNWFIPPNAAGVLSYAGRDSALALMPAPADEGPVLLGEKPRRRSPPVLVFTRVSGVRGLAVRLGIFARSFKRSAKPGGDAFFDLGGGLIAFGRRGARPAFGAVPKDEIVSTHPVAAGSGPLPLGRLTVNAEILARSQNQEIESPNIDTLKIQGLPEEVLAAILSPPQVQQLFAIKNPPSSVAIDFFAEGNRITAEGVIVSAHLPPLPKQPLTRSGGALDDATPMGEGFLPLDLRACFLRHVASEMNSSKGQRRWLARFDDLDSIDADLEELWPSFGNSFYFAIDNPPKESDTMGYALLNGSIPFNALKPRARLLLRDLAKTFPEIRVQRARNGDRYIFESSSIFRPAITVAERELQITSDAGPAIFRDNTGEPAAVIVKPAPASYFIRLDGERLAPTAEKGWVVLLDDLEERIGTREFMARYPQPEVYVRLARKLTRLLGKFALEIQPLENADARVTLDWTPASIVAPDVPKKAPVEDVAPPPPL